MKSFIGYPKYFKADLNLLFMATVCSPHSAAIVIKSCFSLIPAKFGMIIDNAFNPLHSFLMSDKPVIF